MSSCLGGGGRAIRLDLDIIKSPTTSWTSNSSSPTSTLSESSNSPLAISTRKPRTPRKRPNQTYNEAAALLSTAYPKIFSTKHLKKPPCKFTKQTSCPFSYESSDILLPFRGIDNSSFLIQHHHHHQPPVPNYPQKVAGCLDKPCLSPGEINSDSNSNSNSKGGDFFVFLDEFNEDFDAESILDEEVEEGIDSILGHSSEQLVVAEGNNNNNDGGFWHSPTSQMAQLGTCYGYPVGLGFGINFDYGFGMRNNITRAFRNADEGDWWRFPSVNVHDVTPAEKKKKKKKKVEKLVESKDIWEPPQASLAKEGPSIPTSHAINKERGSCANELSTDAPPPPIEPKPNVGLLLKLNYDNVLNDWSDGPSPFSDDSPVAAEAQNDVQARLSKIDLFSDSGVREVSVLRYKEKRRTRLFYKKIRYQVRKVNADRRPRMKGRFVRRPDSPDSEQG